MFFTVVLFFSSTFFLSTHPFFHLSLNFIDISNYLEYRRVCSGNKKWLSLARYRYVRWYSCWGRPCLLRIAYWKSTHMWYVYSQTRQVNLNAFGDNHVSFTAMHVTFSPCGSFILVSTGTADMCLYMFNLWSTSTCTCSILLIDTIVILLSVRAVTKCAVIFPLCTCAEGIW